MGFGTLIGGRKRRLLILAGTLFAAVYPAGAADPKLPLLVWDVDFKSDPVGLPPQAATKAEAEASLARPGEEGLPIRRYSALTYITRTRVASVEASALGLTDKPLLFSCSENRQPQYGPQVTFRVPFALAARATKWRLSLDVAMGNVAIMGGIMVGEAGSIQFHEDGTVRANKIEVARYLPNVPVHLDILLEVPTRQMTITTGGHSVTVPWSGAAARPFNQLRLDGLLPGGHAQVPGKIAFDNIRLEMLEGK